MNLLLRGTACGIFDQQYFQAIGALVHSAIMSSSSLGVLNTVADFCLDMVRFSRFSLILEIVENV